MTEIVDWLTTPHGRGAIDIAVRARQVSPDPLAVAACLQRELDLPAPYRAAATLQAELRSRLLARWGEAPEWLLTRDGIEQATHPSIRRWRSALMNSLGATAVADLGCALGFESQSFADAGLRVRAVERDLESAAIATMNLGGAHARVDIFDVVEDPEALTAVLEDVDAVFIDPARRNADAPRSVDGASGNRISSPHDWSPSWDFISELGERQSRLVAKVAPGIDKEFIPAGAHTTWYAIRGQLAEASIWWPGWGIASQARAIAEDKWGVSAELTNLDPENLTIAPAGNFILDPSPAVTRAGLVTQLAALTGSHRLDERTAFLSSEIEPEDSPLFTTFEVIEQCADDPRKIAAALERADARDVQIVSRGAQRNIEELTKKLKKGLQGTRTISVILARVGDDTQAFIAQRLN